MGMGQMFDPAVSTQDLEKYTAMLSLDETQRDAAKVLLEAYQQEFAAAAKAARTKFDNAREEARESGDFSVMRDIQTEMEAFRKTSATMESGFLSDLKATLTEQQASKWPKLERMRRRERTIGRGLMSGERVDVIRLVDELKLSPEELAAVEPILEQYEQDLDRELAARNEVYDEAQGRARELMQGGDQAEIEKLFSKGRDAATRVREVNRRYARQVEAQLPEDKKAAFAEEVKRASFPQIYRASYAQRVVDAAGAIEGLSEEQKASIASLKESFTRDLGAINKDLEAATEEREATITPDQIMQRFRGGDEGKVGELNRKRREMMNDTIEKVRAVLTEEQREKLPARDQGDGPGFQRRDGQDQDGQRPRRRTRPADENAPPPNRDG
jgi:hypothetical protein